MATLFYEQTDRENDIGMSAWSNLIKYAATKVLSSENGKQLIEVKSHFKRVGSTSGSMRAAVQGSDGTWKGYTAYQDNSSWSTSAFEEKTFTFDSAITLATDDYIIIQSSDQGGSEKYIKIGTDITTPPAFRNCFTMENGSSSWTTHTDRELTIKLYEPDSGGGSGGGGGSSEGDAPTGDGIPQTERLQILSTVIPR